MSRGYVIHRIGRKECERPAASNARSYKNPILMLALQHQAADQQGGADCITNKNLSQRSQCPELKCEEESNPENQDHNTKLVEPIRPEPFFQIIESAAKGKCSPASWPVGSKVL